MERELKNLLKENLFFLKNAEETAVEEFLDSLEEARFFQKGETVGCPAKKECGLGVLIFGRLDITAGENDANIRRMEAPDVFGAASIFGGEGFVSTMRAAADSRIIFIREEQLTALMRKSFTVAQNYIAFLSQKVRFLNQRIENFTAGEAHDILEDYLCSLCDGEGKLPAPKNMSLLAKTLNMGRTSLYRAAEALENVGKLTRSGNEWIIKK